MGKRIKIRNIQTNLFLMISLNILTNLITFSRNVLYQGWLNLAQLIRISQIKGD